ncbi:MAG: PDZ domain-containing protein [Candidatus Acidiferrales bacterium]
MSRNSPMVRLIATKTVTVRHKVVFLFICFALACFALIGAAFAREKIPQQQKPSVPPTLSSSQAGGGAQIQFAFSGNVAQIPAQIAAALVLVPVRVNGSQPSWFVLDTARATSAIDDVRAVAVGLYSPAAGGALPKSFSNVTLEFPGLKISLPSLALDSFGDFSARIGHAVQGVLGADVLSRLILKIDYETQTVQFYDPKAFQYRGSGAQIPVEFAAGVPAIAGKVTVRHRGKFAGLLAIATAQTEPVAFSTHFAATHLLSSLTERMLPFPGVDAASDTDVSDFLGRVQELQFGKVTFDDPIGIFPTKSAGGAGTVPSQFICALGGETLNRFTVILNYPAKLLILEPNKSFPDIFTADMSGLTIIAIPPAFDRFEVAQVARKSPAAGAGIAVGDMIEKIDGNPASDYSLDDVRALLRQEGTSHQLSLLRNGKTIEVKLELRPLV